MSNLGRVNQPQTAQLYLCLLIRCRLVSLTTKALTRAPVSTVGRLEEALQAALSYLLFHKGEEFVTENVAYYREALGHEGEPREVSARVGSSAACVNNTPFKGQRNRGHGRARCCVFSVSPCVSWTDLPLLLGSADV